MANIFNAGNDNTSFLKNYHKSLDLMYIAEAKTSILEGTMYNFVGYNEIRIPDITVQGMGNYDNGYPEAGVRTKQTAYTLKNDRALQFSFDRIEEENVLGPNFNLVSQTFQQAMTYQIIPEYDAKRIADLAGAAATDGKEVIQDLDNTNTILAIDEAIEYYAELGIDKNNLLCFISPAVSKYLKQDSAGGTITRRIVLKETGAGSITREVNVIEGIEAIVIPSNRFMTKVDLKAVIEPLTDANALDFSFVNPADARKINFMLIPKNVGIEAVTRHKQLKTYSPDVNFIRDS